jgi:hypothetical protein
MQHGSKQELFFFFGRLLAAHFLCAFFPFANNDSSAKEKQKKDW